MNEDAEAMFLLVADPRARPIASKMASFLRSQDAFQREAISLIHKHRNALQLPDLGAGLFAKS